MAFLYSPRQLTARSELYHQIGISLSAGLPLTKAVRMLAGNPPARSMGWALERIAVRLEAGDTFSEAVAGLRRWAPGFDVALLEAGERSGRLDHVCKLLAKAYEERARLVRQVILGLLYPAFLFHFAFLIMPVGHLVALFHGGTLAEFFWSKAVFFLPFYLGIIALIYACQSTRGRTWRSLLESLSRLLPIFGKARRALVLARFSTALDALLGAGVVSTRAWPLAAAASGSVALEREIDSWVPRFAEGESAGDIIQRSRAFPQHFSSSYTTAEFSGQIDDALPRLSQYYQEQGLRLMKVAAGVLTGVIYGAVMLAAVVQIFSFWTGHYSNLLDSI